MNFKKLLQQCFGLLSNDNTFPLRDARVSKRTSGARRRQHSRYQPAAEVCESRVMLSAVVVEFSEVQLTDELLGQLADAGNTDSDGIGQSAFFATQTPGNYLLLNDAGAFDINVTVDNGDQQPVISLDGVKKFQDANANGVGHWSTTLDSDRRPGQWDVTHNRVLWVAPGLQRDGEQYTFIPAVQVDGSHNTPQYDLPNIATARPHASDQASELPTEYLQPAEPKVEIATSAQPDVVVKFETEDIGLFESEVGQQVQQALIQYLRPIFQSNQYVGNFTSSADFTSRWMTVSHAKAIEYGTDIFAGVFKSAEPSLETNTERFTTTGFVTSQMADASQSQQPIEALAQLIATAWSSPVEQLVVHRTPQQSTPVVSPRNVAKAITRLDTVSAQAVPAIDLTEPTFDSRQTQRTRIAPVAETQQPQRSKQRSVDDLSEPWLTQYLVDYPQADRFATESESADPIRIVSADTQFALPAGSSQAEHSRKSLAALDPQAVLVESDAAVQRENDRPGERDIQFATLQQLRFEQSPRGPPLNQTIGSGFELNRASQLRLKQLRHSLAPRSPSTVSVA